MMSENSDDLIARVRAYLHGLEPPVRADDLTDEEVGEMVLWGIRGQPASLWHSLLPERLQPGPPMIRLTAKPPPPPKPKPPATVEYVRGGWFTSTRFAEATARLFGRPATPPEPPPPPH